MKNFKFTITIVLIIFLALFMLRNSNLQNARIEPTEKKLSPSQREVVKQNKVLNDFVESTPFVWKGKLMYFVSERTITGKDHKLAIYDFDTNKRIASFGEGLGLGSVLVHDQILYIFATKDWGKKGESEVYLIKSSDLINFSDPVGIYKAKDKQAVFNTSVTRNTDNNKFIMAMEVDEDDFVAFTIRLLESDDLISWRQIPNTAFGKDLYVACPSIRYINKEYYMWFLSEEYNDPNCRKCLTYVVKIAKSKNLTDWEISPHRFITPGKSEGINTSDLDLTEFNNKVYIFYAAGDQATWSQLKYAVYNSTLTILVKSFFEK